MQTCLNVNNAHWACKTVRLFDEATTLPLNQICGHRATLASFWSIARYKIWDIIQHSVCRLMLTNSGKAS